MSPKKHDPASGVEKGNDQLVGKQDDHVDLTSGETHVLECADDMQKPSYAKILESSDAQVKPVDRERASENERWVLVDKLKKRNISTVEGNRLMVRLSQDSCEKRRDYWDIYVGHLDEDTDQSTTTFSYKFNRIPYS